MGRLEWLAVQRLDRADGFLMLERTCAALVCGYDRAQRHVFRDRAMALSKAAATPGEFATDDQVRAAWAKHAL